MALSDTQVRQLRAKLDGKHVKTRKANGADLHYVEGWHVIAEANRIFGYDAWDRRTLASRCVWSGAEGVYYEAAYTAKVRVSVRAGDIIIVREGSGSGEAKAPTPGQAHELALKGAETDATKRALATFGNPFGLALYDREQVGVRKSRGGKSILSSGPWIIRSASGGEEASFDRPSEFAAALRKAMGEAKTSKCYLASGSRMSLRSVRSTNTSNKIICRSPELHHSSWPTSSDAPSDWSSRHAASNEVQAPSAQAPMARARRSTRACSPSANLSGIDPKSICSLSLSSLVSSVGDRRRTRITSVSLNPRDWHSR